jgi:hypothetical protein
VVVDSDYFAGIDYNMWYIQTGRCGKLHHCPFDNLIADEQNYETKQTHHIRRQAQWEPDSNRNEHCQPIYDGWPVNSGYQMGNGGAYHNVPSEYTNFYLNRVPTELVF